MDIFFTVLKGHYVAYACKLLGIKNCSESSEIIATIKSRNANAKCAFLAKISFQVTQKFTINAQALVHDKIIQTKDSGYDYAAVFCHYASLALEFKRSWDEGDGEHVIRCWKLFLMHFRCSTSNKYAWEALRL